MPGPYMPPRDAYGYSTEPLEFTFEGGRVVLAVSLNRARRQLDAPAAAIRCTRNGVDQWPPGHRVEWPANFV